jgi:hypothetical protein
MKEKKAFGPLQILAINDKSATITKAMPVQNRSWPVRKYTMAATMIAGIRTKNSFMRTIIIKPIIIRIKSNGRLSQPSPKLLRIEYTIGRKSAKFMSYTRQKCIDRK